MPANRFDRGLALSGVVLATLSLAFAFTRAQWMTLVLGVVVGVLAAPWVRRAAAWLVRHLGR